MKSAALRKTVRDCECGPHHQRSYFYRMRLNRKRGHLNFTVQDLLESRFSSSLVMRLCGPSVLWSVCVMRVTCWVLFLFEPEKPARGFFWTKRSDWPYISNLFRYNTSKETGRSPWTRYEYNCRYLFAFRQKNLTITSPGHVVAIYHSPSIRPTYSMRFFLLDALQSPAQIPR